MEKSWIRDPLNHAVRLRNYYYIKLLLDAGFKLYPSKIYHHDLFYHLLDHRYLGPNYADLDCMNLLLESGYTNNLDESSTKEITAKIVRSFLGSKQLRVPLELSRQQSEIIDKLLEGHIVDLRTLDSATGAGKLLNIESYIYPCTTFPGFHLNDKETYLLRKFIQHKVPIQNRHYVIPEKGLTMLEYFILRNNVDAAKLLLAQNISTNIGIHRKIECYSRQFAYTKVFPFKPLVNKVFYIYEPQVTSLTLAILRCPDLIIPILEGGSGITNDLSRKRHIHYYMREHLTGDEINKLNDSMACDHTLAELCLGHEYEHIKNIFSTWPVKPLSLMDQSRGAILEHLHENKSLNLENVQSLRLPTRLQEYLISQ